eukprot:CAMPEP_0183295958 /NCGR_PEP_ID=MMETSP0160_2-20130417/3708_1 /TAXON_ID=2839 ORGANISM="Odontella Sinensis, Strain Grunow 1884" /NCGR_SAMPLE_ID=MMETSP0160_2 /ASSEMBLY_ACC=CAM_ASM_000250 /LENGTH=505 /DNA_ID=CAMNT_0025457507 /DNA_START=47 /DNA_END=1564 /DNA_ORIENTATION=+
MPPSRRKPYAASALSAAALAALALIPRETAAFCAPRAVPNAFRTAAPPSASKNALTTPLSMTPQESSATESSLTESSTELKSMTVVDDLDDIDWTNPEAVVCARGVCAPADEAVVDELCYLEEDEEGALVGMRCEPNSEKDERNVFSVDFLWPRALLLGCSMLYGTNFPLGRIMNDALPASATTSGRMLLAAVALSPFLPKLKPELRRNSLIGGCFCALGYLSQSVALLDVPAATVAFLGALVVIITPVTSAVLDDAKLGWKDSPQTWIAALLCIIGVGSLELGGEGGLGDVGWGDLYAILQAVGFGVAFRFTEGMMAKEPDQALPITAVQVGMTAFFGAVWAALDGTGLLGGFGGDNGAWLLDATTREQYALPGLFLSGFSGDETLRNVAIAAGWTGLITTAANRVGETTGLGKMTSSEAAVLLATEPLWAAVFASILLGETMGPEDVLGGALIVAACLTSALLKREDLEGVLPGVGGEGGGVGAEGLPRAPKGETKTAEQMAP